MERNLYFYSERGMVNSIISSIYNTKTAAFHFLKCIYNYDNKQIIKENLKDIKSIDIFDEFSFAGFGDPDLIIKVTMNDDKVYLFFIEAKVGTYESSVRSKNGCVKISDGYKNNASRINFQLRLKKRFFDAYYSTTEFDKGIISPMGTDKYDYKDRKLKKESVIKVICEKIMPDKEYRNNIYFVSMTADLDNPYILNKDALPCLSDEIEEYKTHLGYILYSKSKNSMIQYYIDWCDDSNKSTNQVLYGKTRDMFNYAKKAALNTDDSSEED